MVHAESSGSAQINGRLIPYEIRTGLDGKRYAVFANCNDRDDFHEACPDLFAGCRPACFGQFDNAFCIE